MLCRRLTGWSYAEIAAEPVPVLLLCERMRWSPEQLHATPSQVVRDFLVIAECESEVKSAG